MPRTRPGTLIGRSLVLSLVIGHWSLVILPAGAEELRWKLKPDDEFLATIEQKSEVASNIGGAAPTLISMESGLELAWKVTAVDDQGAATMSQRFQRLRMKLTMPKGGEISYDSASEAKPTGDARTIATALEPLLKSAVTLTLSIRGEISDVQLDAAAQKAVEGLAAGNALKTLLSKEGMENVLRQTLVVLPEGDVEPGSEWRQTAELPTAFGKVQQSTTFKLLEPDAKSPDLARIESVSQLELEPAAASKPRATTLKQQEHKGLILFDNAAGRLRSAEIEQELVTASSLKNTPIQVRLVSSLKMTLEAK